IQIRDHSREDPPFTAIGILTRLDMALVVKSVFHLPVLFELRHLHNEIDEIAEQMKAARFDHFGRGALMVSGAERQLA
ncbi:hypothetical protein NL351_30640, partial [Klebsiella pneumoniae]|nr:hypothetical protein [Klebsiella pneumoniae]